MKALSLPWISMATSMMSPLLNLAHVGISFYLILLLCSKLIFFWVFGLISILYWYCFRAFGFDLGRTDAWHWFVKPLLFLIRVILGRVSMVVFLWFFKFPNLNYLTNLPSLAHIFVSHWPLVLCSSIFSCLFWILIYYVCSFP